MLTVVSIFVGVVGVTVLPFRPEFVRPSTAVALSVVFFAVWAPALSIGFLQSKGRFGPKVRNMTLVLCTTVGAALIMWLNLHIPHTTHSFGVNAFAFIMVMSAAAMLSIVYVRLSMELSKLISAVRGFFTSPS